MGFISTLIHTFGGRWFDERWRPQLDTPEWRLALNFYVDLVRKYGPPGVTSDGHNECRALFATGKAAIWVDATVAASYMFDPAESRVAEKVAFAGAPIHRTATGCQWLWSWALAVPASSRHPEEAKRFIAEYFERFAGVRRYLDEAVQRAREKGYAETIFGRRRYIPELKEKNFNIRSFGERVATNAPIQGSAADLIKIAMVRIGATLRERFTARLLLQVHDELVAEAPAREADEVAGILRRHMEGVADLAVPLVADVGIGANWLDAKAG